MEEHTLIAGDLAKSVFEIAVSHEDGKVAKRRQLQQAAFLASLIVGDADSSLPDRLRPVLWAACEAIEALTPSLFGCQDMGASPEWP